MIVKREQDHESLRYGGVILSDICATIVRNVKPGVNTLFLDQVAAKAMKEKNVTAVFHGYHGYPAHICTSVNATVVHGIPLADHVLQTGDLLSIDLGIQYQGLITDMAVTIGVGTISSDARMLLRVTKGALEHACASLTAGMTTGDLGAMIQEYVEHEGFSVVRDLVGHGVGRNLHEEPALPNFGIRGQGTVLAEGMALAIEPMVTAGDWHVKTLPDGWGVITADGSLAAHFEHTVILRKGGVEILTSFV